MTLPFSRLVPSCCVILTCAATTSGVLAEPNPQDFMIVRAGQLPIILSAPHGGTTPMPDIAARGRRGATRFVVQPDTRTMELTEKLAAAIERQMGRAPFVIIAKFERKHVDANRPAEDAYDPPGTNGPKQIYEAYHRAIAEARAEVQKTFGRGILLDIHGQKARIDGIFRGTNNRLTVSHLIGRSGQAALEGPKSILGVLTAKGYPVIPAVGSNAPEHKSFTGGYTVRTHGSRNGGTVDAIQLEFGTTLRLSENLDRTANDVADAIAVFAKEYLPPN